MRRVLEKHFFFLIRDYSVFLVGITSSSKKQLLGVITALNRMFGEVISQHLCHFTKS